MILSVENGCFSYKNSKDKLLLEDINTWTKWCRKDDFT